MMYLDPQLDTATLWAFAHPQLRLVLRRLVPNRELAHSAVARPKSFWFSRRIVQRTVSLLVCSSPKSRGLHQNNQNFGQPGGGAMSAKLRVQELRDALAKRGLDTAGLKPVLVARLDEAIKNEEGQEEGTDEATKEEDKGSIEKKADNSPADDKDKVEDTGGEADTPGETDGEPLSKRLKMTDVDKMLVPELKAALSDRGLACTGKKQVLKKRLKAAVRDDVVADKDNEEPSSDEEENIVKATRKGRAVLDPHLSDDLRANCHVLEQGDEIYHATLNQTNVDGNNNKFYVIQALENDRGGQYHLFTRWGRVGSKGSNAAAAHSSRDSVVRAFEYQFQSKTRNKWVDRQNFEPKPGKYTWIELDYEPEEKQQIVRAPAKTLPKEPRALKKLNPHVESLISLICNIKMMQQQMIEIGYDARKMPLGKLSKSTILKGFDVLKRIAAALESSSTRDLNTLSSEFYTVIPHDFGRQNMRNFVINTPGLLKKKLEMVEALGEIEVATTILGNMDADAEEEDPAFYHYTRLKCTIEPLPLHGEEATWITAYVQNTHGQTHQNMGLEVQQVFKVARENEHMRYEPFAGVSNRMLLWHGSRLCNWTGILSQGLRIAPPEAPVSGYMFGKGVYFADMVSKSANYCYTSRQEPIGVLLLCEVALGEMRELLHSDYHADQLPPGKLSTKGIGLEAPDPSGTMVCPDGVVVPMGKPVRRQIAGASLQYNEYIVYNTAQIRMKYLLMVKFHHSGCY